jgi:hypothetical protein
MAITLDDLQGYSEVHDKDFCRACLGEKLFSALDLGEVTTFELSSKNAMWVYVPKGVAHGFQTLVPNTIVHYFITAQYSSESSYSTDPVGEICMDWSLTDYLVSEFDAQRITLAQAVQSYPASING